MSSLSRRFFLKAGSIAAAIGLLPTTSSAAAPVAGQRAVAAAKAYPFRWCVSFDGGELFSADFDTKEEAIAYAQSCRGGGLIAECRQQDFDLRISGDMLYDLLQDANYDLIGEGDFIDATREQLGELEDAVNRVIHEWACKHKVNRTAWQFGEVRNREEIAGRRGA